MICVFSSDVMLAYISVALLDEVKHKTVFKSHYIRLMVFTGSSISNQMSKVTKKMVHYYICKSMLISVQC